MFKTSAYYIYEGCNIAKVIPLKLWKYPKNNIGHIHIQSGGFICSGHFSTMSSIHYIYQRCNIIKSIPLKLRKFPEK